MKRGLIIYVTEGGQCSDDSSGLQRLRCRYRADALRVASSEFDVTYGWWELVTRGMQEVVCVRAKMDEASEGLQVLGPPLRLCG